MWAKRKRFIPVYYKNDFFPFIQSTGRSEGTNARFKDNVGPTYSLVSFMREYQRIIDVIRNKDEINDNQSSQKVPKQLHYGYTIEQQEIENYNRNIYLKFMHQLRQTESYKYMEIEKGKVFKGWYKSNQIKERKWIRKYIVLTDLTEGKEDFSCICGKFNKDGIFCVHVLKVIVEEEINKIPDKYFIDKWRKKEPKISMQPEVRDSSTHELLRFNMILRQLALLASKGSKIDKATDYLCEELKRIGREVDILLADPVGMTSSSVILENNETISLDSISINVVDGVVVLKDPDRIQQKGRPKKPKRLMAMVEKHHEKEKKEEANRKTIRKQQTRVII